MEILLKHMNLAFTKINITLLIESFPENPRTQHVNIV